MAREGLQEAFDGPPTQAFTTAGLLLEFVDKKVSLTLRDGTVVVGQLRSFDQFGSFVVQDAVERIFNRNQYSERKLGVWIIRGETVALVGDVDPHKDAENEQYLEREWQHVDYETLRRQRDEDRDELEQQRKAEMNSGLQLGLTSSTATGNPYRF